MSESKTATGVEIDQFLGELEQRAADIDIDAETQMVIYLSTTFSRAKVRIVLGSDRAATR